MALHAPRHLSSTSKSLYKRVASDYGLDVEPAALEVLRLACEALDRAADARDALAEHGTVYVDRFGQPRARPEVVIERDARLASVRCFRELALDPSVADEDSRPPRAASRSINGVG